MRAMAVTFADAADGLRARAAVEAMEPAPAGIGAAVLGAYGQKDDGAYLLAIHIEDERVDLVHAIVEGHGGKVIDILRLPER
jgi:hypothetical protein